MTNFFEESLKISIFTVAKNRGNAKYGQGHKDTFGWGRVSSPNQSDGYISHGEILYPYYILFSSNDQRRLGD